MSVEEPELEPLPVGGPPSPHDTGGVAPESLLDPPLPLEVPAPEPLPELLLPELPVLELSSPEPLLLVAP